MNEFTLRTTSEQEALDREAIELHHKACRSRTMEEWLAARAEMAAMRLEPAQCVDSAGFTRAGDDARKREYNRSWVADIPIERFIAHQSSDECATAYPIAPMFDLLPEGHWARDPQGLAPLEQASAE